MSRKNLKLEPHKGEQSAPNNILVSFQNLARFHGRPRMTATIGNQGALHYAKLTSQRSLGIPEENEMTFSGWLNRASQHEGLSPLSIPFSKFPVVRAKNRFVKSVTANFGRNIPTEISEPPTEVVPNITVGRKRNGWEMDLSIWIPTEILGIFELSENKLSNNKLSNYKLSDNNLASELVEK